MANTSADTRPADAPPGNWVDRWAPERARPYLRLARIDRPIGAWLLMWPCWWSAALAASAAGAPYPDPWHLLLFFIGAFVMRAAGCCWDDIVDRDYDAKIARTQARPIPSGQVSVGEAIAEMVLLSLAGLVVLLQFNTFTVLLGMGSLAFVAIYPFMKRITYWPQVVFAFAFSWGALMGWAGAFASLALPAFLLYAGSILWNIGYDTIYAHQDKEDDAIVGVKSTALRFGPDTQRWLTLLYGASFVALVAAGLAAGASALFLAMMAVAAVQLGWQIVTLDIDDPANCLTRFKSNHALGLIVFAAFVVDAAAR